MLWFRGHGYVRYDWGGLFEREDTPEQAGINRFKREFGGREVRAYDCFVPVTLKGRLRLELNRLGDGLRALRARARPRAATGSAGSAARPA
jgi:CelD/BcsL family acetyltransferase involved in cellulose biosynthesis